LGELVFWAIIRTAIVLPLIWILKGYLDYQLWWAVSLVAFYGVIIHPAIIHYRLFTERNKDIIEDTLCSSCENFDKSAVLCLKHDKHPTKDYIPCEGIDWFPKPTDDKNEIVY
jgi:fatty acid desaturase